MRKCAGLFFLAVLVFSSCNKSANPVDGALVGKWKMVAVTDNAANTVTAKPAGVNTDVVITIGYTFLNNGKIAGNLIGGTVNGNFITGGSKAISIPFVRLSWFFDVLDFSGGWNQDFYENITLSRNYIVDSAGNNLHINCSNNKTLSFVKQ